MIYLLYLLIFYEIMSLYLTDWVADLKVKYKTVSLVFNIMYILITIYIMGFTCFIGGAVILGISYLKMWVTDKDLHDSNFEKFDAFVCAVTLIHIILEHL